MNEDCGSWMDGGGGEEVEDNLQKSAILFTGRGLNFYFFKTLLPIHWFAVQCKENNMRELQHCNSMREQLDDDYKYKRKASRLCCCIKSFKIQL